MWRSRSSRNSSAPRMLLSRMFPTCRYPGPASLVHPQCSKAHWNPHLAAAAAVCRVWFDWIAPTVTSVSAPVRKASPTRNSSLRDLLPPPASPVRSSRLIHRSGPPGGRRNGRAYGSAWVTGPGACGAGQVVGTANRRVLLYPSSNLFPFTPRRHEPDCSLFLTEKAHVGARQHLFQLLSDDPETDQGRCYHHCRDHEEGAPVAVQPVDQRAGGGG